jgi:hypothetical protein
MGKKRTRSAKTSKGERRSIVAGVKEVRQGRSTIKKAMNKLIAWKKGQNPWVTVPLAGSKDQFIRVRANTVYGDHKKSGANLFGGKADVG